MNSARLSAGALRLSLAIAAIFPGQALPYTLAVPGTFAFRGPLRAYGSYADPESFALRAPLTVPKDPGVRARPEVPELPQTVAKPGTYAIPASGDATPQTFAAPGSFWR